MQDSILTKILSSIKWTKKVGIFNELFILNHCPAIATIKYISYGVVEITKISTKGTINFKTKKFLLTFG